MSSQGIKANLVGVGLFVTSIGGTFAIFGCVPMLAHLLSPGYVSPDQVSPTEQQASPSPFQAFPEVTNVPDASSSFKAVSDKTVSGKTASKLELPNYRSKQAQTVSDRRAHIVPRLRSAL